MAFEVYLEATDSVWHNLLHLGGSHSCSFLKSRLQDDKGRMKEISLKSDIIVQVQDHDG